MSDQEDLEGFAVLLSLGSNIDPEENLPSAVKLLSVKFKGLMRSSVWETPAVGSSGPNYHNCAVLFHSTLSQNEIKEKIIKPIEDQLGRIRTADKFVDRTIDLDILIYGSQVLDPELWSQAHLAIPASELMPDLNNAEAGETLQDTAARLLHSLDSIRRLDLS